MQSNIIIDPPNEKHRLQWLNSGISELIIDANLHTITDHRTINHLLGWKTPKGAAGKQSKDDRTCWAVWGVNPDDRESMYFGVQIKPDTPRINPDGKPIKYESTVGKGEARQPLFLKVPTEIWQELSDKWSYPIQQEDKEQGFWAWVKRHPIPIIITEGAKKAGALLSNGYVAISVPGVSNGQHQGELNLHLKPFCTVGRKVLLAYDSDLHFKTEVRKELDRLGRLVALSGSVPYVMQWEQSFKGIDDLIIATNKDELDRIVTIAKTFEAYRREEFETDGDDLAPIEKNFNQIAVDALYGDRPWVCIYGVLYRWTGTYYEESPDDVELNRIGHYCNSYLVYDSKKRRRVYVNANSRSVSAVLDWQKIRTKIHPSRVNPFGLNLANGVLRITWKGKTPDWKLEKHDPKNVYTYVSKVRYEENADPSYCDRLLGALDPAQRAVFLGTCAAAFDLPTVRMYVPQRVRTLLLKGEGNNGKDTLRVAISEIFSQGLTGCSFKDFQQYDEGRKFPLAVLEYSRINWASENHSNLCLDKLQVLKNMATGDPITIEHKNEKERSVIPNCILLFNCNQAPSIMGAQEAIASRYAVINFAKTFKQNPTSPDEIAADPRFKYDPAFITEKVCPSLLNELLKSLKQSMTEGIDYKPLDGALNEIREDSCHVMKWAKDINLEYGDGRIRIGDLHKSLHDWYQEQGILEIEFSSTGKEKLNWLDEGNRFDPFIKAPRLMREALAKVYPKAKFSQRTEFGFFVIGLQSKYFSISPNFGSFGSAEEKNQDTVRVLAAEPNPEPNNFGSFSKFGSDEPNEPNNFGSAAQNPINHAASVPNEPNEPKNTTTNSNFAKNSRLKVGDLVRVKFGSLAGRWFTIESIKPDGKTCVLYSDNAVVKPEIDIENLGRG
jgi:putative DNA primase/helicase